MSSPFTKRFAMPFLALAAISGGSFLATATFHYTRDNPARAAEVAKAEPTKAPAPEIVAPANDLSAAFRSVHNAVKDAVVNINIAKKYETPRIPQNMPEEFRRFFGPDAFPDIPGRSGHGQPFPTAPLLAGGDLPSGSRHTHRTSPPQWRVGWPH